MLITAPAVVDVDSGLFQLFSAQLVLLDDDESRAGQDSTSIRSSQVRFWGEEHKQRTLDVGVGGHAGAEGEVEATTATGERALGSAAESPCSRR